MKIKEEQKEKQFEPFDLTITIENEHDLIALWAIFNVSKMNMIDKLKEMNNRYAETKIKFDDDKVEHCNIWNYIDEKLNSLNLIKYK
jgi:hypothetical protein